MKKKKLSLESLEVKSFVTNLEGSVSRTIKGGLTNTACPGQESDNIECGTYSTVISVHVECIITDSIKDPNCQDTNNTANTNTREEATCPGAGG